MVHMYTYLFELILIAILITAVCLIIYARWNYGTLEKLGIPVVKPHWILGSNFNGHNVNYHVLDFERSKVYGHVYGLYEGRTPHIYISDPEIIQKIFTTDFECFRNRRKFPGEDPIVSEVLDFLDDKKWKTVRATLTPHFTTGKTKAMCDAVSDLTAEYVDALVKDLNENNRMKLDFRKYVPALLLEIIGKCFCGIQVKNARDKDNKLINTLKIAMGGDYLNFDWTHTFANAFPILHNFIPVLPNHAIESFKKIMKDIFESREKSKVKKIDMVNTLMELYKTAETDENYQKMGITKTTALGQAFTFFFASYDGMRTTLSLLIYYLATHKDIHKRLTQEVDRIIKTYNGKISYDTVADMHYLTACISETLRLTPDMLRSDRLCTNDWEYRGLKISKGAIVIIPLYALHKHADYYNDPEVFDPERFMKEGKDKLHPYAFASFGHGPKSCIAQKFSYEMLKIIACHYLKVFTIEAMEDTVFKPTKGNPMFLQYEPIYVDFVKRSPIQ